MPLAELYQATVIGANYLSATSPPDLAIYHPSPPFHLGHAHRLPYALAVKFRQSAGNTPLLQPIEAGDGHSRRKAARA